MVSAVMTLCGFHHSAVLTSILMMLILFFYVCTAYSFITGFIFYNFDPHSENGQRDAAYSFIEISSKYKNNLVGLNRDAFDISKESAVRGIESDQATRESMYNFCTGRQTRHDASRQLTLFCL
jgi:hypothetical protein